MANANKARITYNGVALAANAPIVWKFQTGVTPFVTMLSVHKGRWDSLKGAIGKDGELKIIDARGETITIKKLTILHKVPSDSPYRVNFLVADARWRWPYRTIIRDYNVTRKSGDRRTIDNIGGSTSGGIELFDDIFGYLEPSLNNGKLWTAKEAVEDVLNVLTSEPGAGGRGSYVIEGFPIQGEGEDGQFSLQNVTLRGSGEAELSRLLSYIPGAEVYIDKDGKARVIDAADYSAAEQFFTTIPKTTYEGEFAAMVDREMIRPKKVKVYYQREVECVFDYSDDYGPTTSTGANQEGEPFLTNVVQTVDLSTTVSEYDAQKGEYVRKTVAQGAWVAMQPWLEAMNNDRPRDNQGRVLGQPWTFETISHAWVSGELDQLWGGGGGNEFDLMPLKNLSARIGTFKRHFRQTFRINPAYMDRIRDLLDVRVRIVDPVKGTRSPAAVWNQYCISPTTKGIRMAPRVREGTPHETQGTKRNVDALARYDAGEKLVDTPTGNAEVVIIDKELGIIRVEGMLTPYGQQESITPCHIVDRLYGGTPKVPTRDLSLQDRQPIGAGMRIEGQTAGVYLRKTMRLKAMLTIVPAAPNNEKQCHLEEVEAGDVGAVFRSEFRIQSGKGPDLEVFVPPGEVTARFAWDEDSEAEDTVGKLLGIGQEASSAAEGIEGPDLPGFKFVNKEEELRSHAVSIAAEMLAPFADNLQGRVVTHARTQDAKLVGNMASASIQVAAAPSGRVSAAYEFPGQAKALSRMAILPDAARKIILGTVPFRDSGKK